MSGERESAFPDGFVWGAATAAHQIEGGNWNNDWWAWEHTPHSGCVEPSGDACDSWNRWRTDVDLCEQLGFGSYRFSIEWSRIEPERGEFSNAALEHYRHIGEALLERGIDPVVTFHHFTSPRWLAEQGGWAEAGAVDAFARYCERAARALAPVMRAACTINEPNIVALHGFQTGVFPPGQRDRDARRRATDHFGRAHRKAVDAIRAVAPDVPVGLTLSMTDYHVLDGGESRRDQIRWAMEDVFLDMTEGDDFLGVQTYTRERVGPDGHAGPEDGVPTLAMGYELWPQALEACLRRAWEYTDGDLPLLVTENGIGTDDDEQRIAYVGEALAGVLRGLADGLDIRGYTYWSLLDNFEWAYGYGPRFGLVDVDRTTFERVPKPSAHWLSAIARANALPPSGIGTTG